MALIQNISPPVLRRAREHLLEHGQAPMGLIDEQITQSWQRSLAAGLKPVDGDATDGRLSDAALQRNLTRNHELLAYAQPLMEHLSKQVGHTQSMVILADDQGVILHTLGNVDFLNKAERVFLAPGASWSEPSRGTNAIGTALAENRAIKIHGAEHFLERNGFLTCAAAPIISPLGRLLGILDISGDRRGYHPHSLGLVSSVAQMIENRLIVDAAPGTIRLHLHPQAEGLGTVAEGILILSEDGWIMGANQAGCKLLGLSPAHMGSTPLTHCIKTRFADLLMAQQRQSGGAVPITLHNGSPLLARLHMERPALVPGATSVSCETTQIAQIAHITRVAETTQKVETPQDALSGLDTGDTVWHTAADKARRILDKSIPLLLCGESGVGKEIFAAAYHQSSARRDGPFIAINCAALPENLIEAELFGYVPGAFTGASREGNIGRLREAHGGTLFLDEIGDMPLILQTRLLRVLQERQVQPLGGGKAVEVDFALICATHHNLRQATETGAFRKDLYYRINGLTLNLPPLRERSDFAALTATMLADLAPGRHLSIVPELFSQLARYDWPGNLRQFNSVLRTAVAMLNPDEHAIDWSHLPDDILDELGTTALPQSPPNTHKGETGQTNLPSLPRQSLAQYSVEMMRQTLEASGGNVSEAARRLGVSRQTLYRKLFSTAGPTAPP